MLTHAFNQKYTCFHCRQQRVTEFDKSLTLSAHTTDLEFSIQIGRDFPQMGQTWDFLDQFQYILANKIVLFS